MPLKRRGPGVDAGSVHGVGFAVATREVPSINTTALGRVAALAAACAVTPLVLSAAAHAEPGPLVPGPDLRAQCESPEFGGVLTTDVQQGVPRSVCQYIVSGHFYYDTYENGAYVGTAVYRDGKTEPTERPVIPELFTIPPDFRLPGFLGPS